MKDLFVPLKKEYYLKIKSGEQRHEIRPANYRFWNEKNVYPGRTALFSCGYGNHDRTRKVITLTREGPAPFAFMGVPQWHIDAVESIYGKRDTWLVACI